MATPSGKPAPAVTPAMMAHMLNCAPIEISICREMMTSATPMAKISAGICEVSREISGWIWKKCGAKMASPNIRRSSAAATVSSRKYLFIRRRPFR